MVILEPLKAPKFLGEFMSFTDYQSIDYIKGGGVPLK